MASDDSERPNDEDRLIFEAVANYIHDYPDEFREAGQLLDDQYSESAILERDKAEAEQYKMVGITPPTVRTEI